MYETLVGRSVVLEPLEAEHTPDLIDAALSQQSIFEPRRTVHLHDEHEVRDWVVDSLDRVRETHGTSLPFAVVDVKTGRAVGSSWFVNIDARHRRCEIRWTWLAAPLRGSTVNLETKMLMLDHAFGECGYDRIEFRVDPHDAAGRRLLDRLGATAEGRLRNDFLDRFGQRHDTILYSVVIEQWPRLKERIEQRLGGRIEPQDRAAAASILAHAREQRSGHTLEFPLPRG